MKKIITHINPDSDAVAAAWIINRFLPDWQDAEIEFVTATVDTDKASEANTSPDILYADVGRGKLDHHQTGEYTSATKLCWQFVKQNRKGDKLSPLEEQAIEQLVALETEIDNAHDLFWGEVNNERYYYYLHTLIDGLRGLGKSDKEVIEIGYQMLDSFLLNLKNKINAENDLKNGTEFTSLWGKAIAAPSGNKQVIWRGEALGFVLVVIKDPETGGVRIYARPDSKVDLTKAYNEIRKLDPDSDWFLHATKRLLLNQGSVNPNMRPTKLSLEKIIEILKKGGGVL